MALIANRIKNTNNLFAFTRFVLLTLKRSITVCIIGLSIYIFTTAPKQLSAFSLEIVGHVVSGSLFIHEGILKQINLITKNIAYLQDLTKENIELRLEVERLRRLQSDMYFLQAENIELKKLLSVVEDGQYQYVTAKLLSISLNPFSKTALVSAGENHGVRLNQVVTNSDGLVGRVIEVSQHFSKIMLVTDANSRIPIITTMSRVRGIWAGDNDNGRILYLPNQHTIKKGDRVVTSGYGSIYPYGILVGYVSESGANEVVVKPVVDLSKTEFVTVLLPKG